VRIAIDPGISGAIACKTDGKVHAFKVPDTILGLWLLILSLKTDDAFCWMEDVGNYVSGDSATAAVKFANHCGHIEMALTAAGIKYDKVQPKEWMYWLIGRPDYPKIPKTVPAKERRRILAKRKTERKNKIKEKVQGLYPDIKVTLALADALGILTWGLEMENKI